MNQAPLGEVFEVHASKLDARLGMVFVLAPTRDQLCRQHLIERMILAIGTAVA
jgi:hypothetical protein